MRFLSTSNDNKIYDDDVVVDNTNDIDERDDHGDDTTTVRQVSGAAIVGGIVGCCLLGPFMGIVAAGGAAALATSKGTAGSVARSTGDVAADAGDRLQKFDRKHRVVEQTSNGFVKGCRWVSDQLKDKPTTNVTVTK